MSSGGSPVPCGVVLFGASGDLARRKLLPALHSLHREKLLSPSFFVAGTGRSPLGDESFRAAARAAVEGEGAPAGWPKGWPSFASRLFYLPGDPADPAFLAELRRFLSALDRRFATGGRLLYHLAVPPFLLREVAGGLIAAGMARPAAAEGWPRIVVEKPFGVDLPTAVALAGTLHEGFEEERIFRIDHYMARETVQDILLLRFANRVFEPVWSREHVERVEILSAETVGVEGRGATYDRMGVVRDMFQSHLMQLLALAATEPPAGFDAGPVQDAKTALLRRLRPFPADDVPGNIVFGQYGPGRAGRRRLRGYREEEGVRPDSHVPTFARLRLFVDDPRWQGVPFFLTSGKRLGAKVISIVLHFRPSAFPLAGRGEAANRLTLSIHPREGIVLDFLAKEPGAGSRLREASLEFDYAQGTGGAALDPYEKALLDVMAGDHTLFWRQDAVELSWAYLDLVLEACERCVPSPRIDPYPAGSDGPDRAGKLVQGDPVTSRVVCQENGGP